MRALLGLKALRRGYSMSGTRAWPPSLEVGTRGLRPCELYCLSLTLSYIIVMISPAHHHVSNLLLHARTAQEQALDLGGMHCMPAARMPRHSSPYMLFSFQAARWKLPSNQTWCPDTQRTGTNLI